MLDVFFNNKVPSTMERWTDELILVANIFNRLDGQEYEPTELANQFVTISNRVPGARDEADYRDQYGAYATFLGLMYFENQGDRWICRMNPRAREILCNELPDPQAYVRLQLTLLQYPNPIGARFNANGTLVAEPNSLAKRVEQVERGVRTFPFRLLVGTLLALDDIGGQVHRHLSYGEIWAFLFNNPNAVCTLNPNLYDIAGKIVASRTDGEVHENYPNAALRNLHIVEHSGIITRAEQSAIIYLHPEAVDPSSQLGVIAREIAGLKIGFEFPSQQLDRIGLRDWTEQKLSSGEWARYYCGGTLPLEATSKILEPITISVADDLFNNPELGVGAELRSFRDEPTLRARRLSSRPANPEETLVLREKANLQHRLLVRLIADKLRAHEIEPESNIYIDLCCQIPKKLLFEIKSCDASNMLVQVRKGISQLYEYKFRHHALHDARLVLALESKPTGSLSWLVDYIVEDRGISLCWQEGEGNLACPITCKDDISFLVDRIDTD